MQWITVLVAAAWIIVGFLVLSSMARSRGRNPVGWGIFGAIAFLIALIAILIAGPSEDQTSA